MPDQPLLGLFRVGPGRGQQHIRILWGGDQDLVKLKSGRIIYCHYFHNLVKYVEGVKQYQVIQRETDLFEFKIVPQGEGVTSEGERYLRETVRDHLEGSQVEINLVDRIPKDPSGKLRFVLTDL